MTTFYLVRHADYEWMGRRIAGRTPALSLNESGRRQAVNLVRFLRDHAIDGIYSSPLERAVETALPLAHERRLPIVEWKEFNEIDYGSWTGRFLSELDGDEAWRRFHAFPLAGTIPQGESMRDAQARAIAGMLKIKDENFGKDIVVVSHAEIIRLIIAHWLAIPIEHVLRLEIEPASISVLECGEAHAKILKMNLTPNESNAEKWGDNDLARSHAFPSEVQTAS